MKNIFKLCTSVLFSAVISVSCLAAASAEENAAPVETGYALVSVDSYLNVRSQPNMDGDVVGKLVENDVVYITAVSNGWCTIDYGGTPLYISDDYVGNITAQEAGELISAQAELAAKAATVSSSLGQAIVNTAKQYIGVPYVYGGRSPKGFDCSGLTSYVYELNGITLPRSATPQYAMGTKVSKSELQPGDLVFFGSGHIEHVGIYVGDGNFIHSPRPGKSVQIETLMSGYYSRNYYGARRIVG